MPKKLRIISYELVNEGYLRLDVVSGSQPCGSIDLIGEKINFNITGRYFFKGMETIKNIHIDYHKGELIFIFGNKKQLRLGSDRTVFTAISVFL